MKKILYVCLILITFSLKAKVYLPQGMTRDALKTLIAKKKREGNIQCAFDIHKTLVEKDAQDLRSVILRYPHKLAVLANVFNFPLLAEAGNCLWQIVLISLRTWLPRLPVEDIYGERFMALFAETKASDLARLVARVTNAQRVKPGMYALVSDLKKEGYTLYVASNIGRHMYDHLKVKLADKSENIFELFDIGHDGYEGKVVDYDAEFIVKPDTRYYLDYLARYNPDKTKLILFIDDKKKNIREAIKHGMIGFHFTDADHLNQDFVSLGLL